MTSIDFSQEDVQIANVTIKRCYTLLIIMKKNQNHNEILPHTH